MAASRPSPARRIREIPIVATIPAGHGDPAASSDDLGRVAVDFGALNIRSHARTFALKVRGDSMIGAQINDGDIVIIEAREPRVGDVVAALIDGETTLKRLMERDGERFLKAENPRYPDLVPLHGLTIQGVMRTVVSGRPRASGSNGVG